MARVLSLFPDDAAPHDAEAWFERGCALEARSAVQARCAYLRALERDPRHAGALVNLGRLDHEAGDLARAETCFRCALAVDPRHALAAFDLGVTLQDIGRLEEARAAYERAAAADPGLADAHHNLAVLEERSGRPAAALRHWIAYRRCG